MENKKLSISEWAEEDRPREKLLSNGATALTTAELIAILLSSGNAQESAVDLAKRIFNHFDNELSDLFGASINELKQFKGVGVAKAVTIAAAIELARRSNASREGKTPTVIENSLDAYKIIAPNLIDLDYEEFWIICLTATYKMISKFKVGQGGFSESYVDTRFLFQKVLLEGAASIVLCHNHPSGSRTPSMKDIKLTNEIKKSAEIIGIRLFDHIIVTGNSYVSFNDENML